MLQRFVHRLLPAWGYRLGGSLCMPQKATPRTVSTQAITGPASPAPGKLSPGSLAKPRRSLRTRTTLVVESSPTSTSPTAAASAAIPAEPSALLSDKTAKPLRARKRKQSETDGVQTEQSPPSARLPNNVSPQPVPARYGRAESASQQQSDAGAAAASEAQREPLSQAAKGQAKSRRQHKPRAKKAAKAETASSIESPSSNTAVSNVAAKLSEAPDNPELPDATPSKPAKQRKPRKAKTVVKTETVVVTEATAGSALQQAAKASADGTAKRRAGDSASQEPAAASPDGSEKKSHRKPRVKAKVSVEELLQSVDVVPYRERKIPKKWVGAHVSMGGGLEKAVVRAASIGANSFALDTRSKRRWESPPISVENADAFKAACKDYGFGPEHILPHGSYLINLASAEPELLLKSYTAFVDELKRCEAMGIRLYNFHPGSTAGKCPPEEGMDRIADAINRAHAETESVVIVLENMAGAGHSVGHKFEYLRYIIDRVTDKARVGVCLDTCHLFAGGYDVSNAETFSQTMKEFEEVIGLQYLKGMHVNDSKAALGSRKDRHENVAKGLIGEECFSFIMNDDRFNGIPLIMETPVQCHGPDLDYKLSLLAGGPVYKGPSEEETGVHTDKRDIAYLNSLAKE